MAERGEGTETVNRADRNALLETLKAANGGEALFRPSSAGRWTKCLGSVHLGSKAPKDRKSSVYADEGTAAHIVVADALEGKRQPEEWVDRWVQLPGRAAGQIVDEEMMEAAQFTVGVVAERWTPTQVMKIEHQLSLAALDPTDPLLGENRGTGDCVLIDPGIRKLTIIDLKYGKGVQVPGDSPQLKDYALMGLLTFAPLVEAAGGWAEVETIVVQPRNRNESDRIKAVSHDPFDLMMSFAGTLVGSMEAALDPEAPLVTGSHCRWCPAAAICPALKTEATNIAQEKAAEGFAAVPMHASSPPVLLPTKVYVGTVEQPRAVTAEKGLVTLPSASDLAPAEISTILGREEMYDAFMAAVKHRAVQYLEGGIEIPGWGLESRSGNRRWKDVETLPALLRDLGLKTSEMYTEPKLLSPAQMEKKLPTAKRALIADQFDRPMGAPTLTKTGAKSKKALAPVMGAIPEENR